MRVIKALGNSLILFVSTSIGSMKSLLTLIRERVIYGGRKFLEMRNSFVRTVKNSPKQAIFSSAFISANNLDLTPIEQLLVSFFVLLPGIFLVWFLLKIIRQIFANLKLLNWQEKIISVFSKTEKITFFRKEKLIHNFALASQEKRQALALAHRASEDQIFVATKYPVLAIIALVVFATIAYAWPEKYQLANLKNLVEKRHCLVSETYDEKVRQCLVSARGQDLAYAPMGEEKTIAKSSSGKEMVLAEETIAPDEEETIAPIDPTKRTITLTGMLNDGQGNLVDGTYETRFAIYTADRTELDPYPSDTDRANRVWEETQTVKIKKGLFQVNLGVVNNLPIFTTVQNSQFYVGMRISEDSEMAPRRRISTPFFAINSANSLLLNGKKVGLSAGDIVALDNSGKINLVNLPTGIGDNDLVTGDDERLKFTISGSKFLTLSGQKFVAGKVNLASEIQGILPISGGGTGLSGYTSGDLLYYSSGSTLSKLPIGGNNQILRSNGTNLIWTDETATVYTASGNLLQLAGNDFSLKEGTLTDGRICTYSAVNGLDCTTSAGSVGVNYWTLSGNDLYPNDMAYNVGIGTSSPAAKLDVAGNLTLSGNILRQNSTQSIGSATERFYYGYFDYLDVTNMSIGGVDISGTISNTLTVNSDNVTADTEDSFLAFERGSVTPNAQLQWDATNNLFAFNFPLSVSGVITATGGSSTNWNTAYTNRITSATLPLSISSNSISIAQATTTTDGYLSSANWNTFNAKQAAYANLTTIGSLANSTGWLYNNGSGTFSYTTPTGLISGLTAGYLPYATSATALANSNLYFTTGNIGIGTTNPGEKLEVAGSVVLANSNYYAMRNTSGIVTPLMDLNSANNLLIGTSGIIQNIFIQPGTSTVMTLKNTGLVGIGEASPGSKLSILGGMAIGSTTAFSQATIASGNLAIEGNVGIGTTSPNQKLSIAGSLGILEGGTAPQYYTVFQGGDQNANLTYTLPVASGTDGQVLKTDSGNNLYWATVAGGSGGIGTVTSVGSGNGLTGGPITSTGTLSISLLSANGGTASTSSYSGLQFSGASDNQLSLLQGCANNEVLSWDNSTKVWKCASVSGVGGVTGTGTTNYLTKWSSTSGLTSSVLYETGGSIGIGTTNPGTLLDVNGVITASGGTSTNWNTAYTNRITSATLPLSISSNSISIAQATTTTDGYLSSANWNTFNAKQAAYANLTTIGSLANSTGWLYNNGSGTFSYTTPTGLISGLTAGYLPYATSATALANSNLYFTTGNIGIGTTNPLQKLAIEGSLGILEGGTAPQYHTIFQGGDQTVDIVYTLPIGQAGGSNYVLSNNGSGILSWQAVSGVGGVSGTGTNNYLARWTGTSTLSTGATYDDGTNVGIGTTNPGTKLEVNGVITASGGTSTNWNTAYTNRITSATLPLSISSNSISIAQATTTTDGYLSSANWNTFNGKQAAYANLTTIGSLANSTGWLYNNGSGTFSYSTPTGLLSGLTSGYVPYATSATALGNSPLYYDGTNVGIGTTNPVNALDLYRVAADTYASFSNGTVNGLVGISNTNGTFRMGTTNNNYLTLVTNNSTRLSVSGGGDFSFNFGQMFLQQSSGNVGIGTTAPVELLDVNGRLHLAETSAPTPTTDRLYNVSGNLLWNGINLTGGGSLPTGITGQTLYNNAGTWTATNNLYHNGTNVGIGTTAAGTPLDVVGQARASSFADRSGTFTLASNGMNLSSSFAFNWWSGSAYETGIARAGASTIKITDGGAGLGTLIAGNIGIGTTSPLARLHINGGVGSLATGLAFGDGDSGIYEGVDDNINIQINGTSRFFFTNSYLASNGGARAPYIKSDPGTLATNTYSFWLDYDTGMSSFADNQLSLVSGGVERISISDSGNVGIGTTNPNWNLDVHGSLGVSNGLWLTNGSTIQLGNITADINLMTLSTNGTTGANHEMAFKTTNNYTNSEAMRINYQGNVGIGTTNPGTKLEVNGVITASGGTSTNWNTAYTNRITSATLPLSISSNSISIAQATTTTDGYLSSANWNTFNGKQAAYANLTTIGSLANSTGWLYNNGTGTFSYSTPTGLLSGLTSGYVPYATSATALGNSGIYFDGTNVGIGTTASAEKLSVLGNGYFSGQLGIGATAAAGYVLDINMGQNDTRFYGNGAGATGFFFRNTDVSTRDWYMGVSGNTSAYGSSKGFLIRDWTGNATRLVINTIGNVGIGTTNPLQKLSIAGTMGILEGGSAPQYYTILQGADQTADITYTLPGSYPGGAGYVLTSATDGTMSWSAAGTGGIGDITGIGNVTSGDAFTASGTQGTQLYFYDAQGRGQLTIADLTQARTYTLPDADGTVVLGTGTQNYVARWTGANNLSTGVLYDDGTNVGIGTTAPGAKLSVIGAITVTNGISINNTSAVAWGNSNVSIAGDSSNNYFRVNVSGAEALRINSSGNIGIGTTAPLAILHLNGGVGSLATGLAFGDGDSGFYEDQDNRIRVMLGGTNYGEFIASGFSSGSGSGALLLYANSTATAPSLIPNRSDSNTGLGWAGADILSLIAGGTNGLNVTVAGNVGIGTTNPSALFSVGATSQFQVNASGNVTAGTYNGNTISSGTGTLGLSTYTMNLTGNANLNQHLLTTSTPSFAGLTVTGAFSMKDDQYFTLGDSNDSIITHRATPVTADTAVAGLIVGTPTVGALGANSTVFSNITGGDFVFIGANGLGNSQELLRLSAVNSKVTMGSGTTALIIDNNGFVGIGTTAPNEKLEIVGGRLRLSQVNEPATPTLNFGDGDTGLYESADDTLNIAIAGVMRAGFNSSTFSLTNGAGMRNVAATATVPNINPVISDTDTGLGAAADNILSLIAGGTNVLNVNASGYVGIGTTAPAYKLHVTGATDNYLSYLYNSGTTASAGGLFIRGDGLGNLLTLNYAGTDVLTVSGAQTTFGNPVNFASAGDVSFANDLVLTNETTGNLLFQGPGNIATQSAWQNLDLTLSAANDGFVVVSDTLQNNLGIGSTAAGTNYGIYQTLSNTGIVTTGTDTTYGLYQALSRTGATGGTINSYGVYSNVTGDTGGTSTAIGGYFSASGADNNFALITGSGNVGIGTTSPLGKLVVSGGDVDFTDTGGSAGDPDFSVAGYAVYSGINLFNSGILVSSAGIGSSGGNNLNLSANELIISNTYSNIASHSFGRNENYASYSFQKSATTSGTTITSTGNFPTATIEPGMMLHIYDTPGDSNEGIYRVVTNPDNDTVTVDRALAVNETGTYTWKAHRDLLSILDNGVIQKFSGGTYNNNISLQPYGGNVGIGTTNPVDPFQVAMGGSVKFYINSSGNTTANGNLSTAGNLYGTSLLPYSTTDDLLFKQRNASYGFGFENSSGGSQLYIKSDGNVGIGTTNPGYTLEINGRMEADRGYFSDGLNIATDKALSVYGSFPHLTLSNQTGAQTNTTVYSLAADKAFILGGAYLLKDWDHGVQTNPTLFVQSNTDPDTNNTEWGSLSFEGTGAGGGYLKIANGVGNMALMPVGNVGIGTTNPLSILHINGGVGSLATGLAFGDGDSGIWENIDDQLNFSVGGASQFYINSNYLVGRNGASLAMSSATATNPVLLPNVSDPNSGIGLAAFDTLSLIAGGTNVLNVNASGYVGIGTTAPAYKLHVTGATDNYLSYLYNSGTTASAGGLFVRGDGLGNLLTLNYAGSDVLNVSGAQTTFSNPVSFASAGNVSLSNDLLLTNTTAGNIRFKGPGYVVTESSWQNLNLTLSAANDGFVVVDDTLQNNLGIGSTAAGTNYGIYQTLSNTGIVTTGTDTTYGIYQALSRTGATGGIINSYGVYSNVTGDTGGTSTAIGGYFSASGADNNFALITGSGNVGIGTTNPAQKFSVISADPTTGGYAGAAILSGATGSYTSIAVGRTAPELYMGISGGAHYFTDAVAGSGVIVHTGKLLFGSSIGGVSQITMDTSGNVGIGTTDPQYALEVSGNIESSNIIGADRFSANAGTVDDVAYKFNGNSGNGMWLPATNTLAFSSNSLERLRINSSGNVGIGTTNPSANTKLDVNNPDATWGVGISKAGTFIGGIHSNGGVLTIQGNTSAAISFSNSTGNIGIGTTNPSATLTVVGSVRFPTIVSGNLVVDANGNVTSSSDERLKEVAGPFTRGLSSILALNPIDYHWNAISGLDQENLYSGFSAQNVQSVIPEAVGVDSRGFLTLSDRPILAATVNAIKEQQGEIENQETMNSEQALMLATLNDQTVSTNDKMNIISQTLTSLTTETQSIASLQAQLAVQTQDLASLQAQMADIQIQNKAFNDFLLAFDVASVDNLAKKNAPLNTFTGQLEAESVVAGAFSVKVVDTSKKTLGDVVICEAGKITKNGICDVSVTSEEIASASDGKTVKIDTTAVSATAKIFITPEGDAGGRVWVEKQTDVATGAYTGFAIKCSDPIVGSLKVNWWIVEEK